MRKINAYVIDKNRNVVWRDLSGSIYIAKKAEETLKYFQNHGVVKPYSIFRSEKEYQPHMPVPKDEE